jgi:hypothetical protein
MIFKQSNLKEELFVQNIQLCTQLLSDLLGNRLLEELLIIIIAARTLQMIRLPKEEIRGHLSHSPCLVVQNHRITS